MTRINRVASLACALVALVSLSACEMRVGDLTFLSTKNVDLSDVQLNAKTGKRSVGEDCAWHVLFIPLGVPNLKDAADRTLEAGNGNVMVDEVTRVRNEFYLLAGRQCYVVEGTVLNASFKK